jgi:hypothetical protein
MESQIAPERRGLKPFAGPWDFAPLLREASICFWVITAVSWRTIGSRDDYTTVSEGARPSFGRVALKGQDTKNQIPW